MSHLIEQQIAEIKEFITRQALTNKEVMNLSEAAIYAGISKSYLYKLTSARLIPFYRPATKLIFFKREEIDAWRLKKRENTFEELSKIPLPRRLRQ